MYYVYRFLDKKKNVICVGKSKQDLEQRFRGHKHLPDDCYALTYRIEYIECSTESDMAIKEIYYINRFRHDGTFFNVLDTADVPASVEFNDKWKQYKGPLGPQFSNSINYTKGYATQKEVRYTKEGLPDRRRPNKEAGVDSYVEGLTSDEVDLLVRYLVDEINEAENNNQEQIRFRNLLMFVLGVNEHLIQVCAQHGLEESVTRPFLEYQILTDFVLTNTDRHLRNISVLRNSNTLEFIGMAPIFDTGNSMFCDNPRQPLHDDLTDIQVNSFKSKEMQLLDYVQDPAQLDASKLPSPEELRQIYEADPMITYTDAILVGYQKKIDLLQSRGML